MEKMGLEILVGAGSVAISLIAIFATYGNLARWSGTIDAKLDNHDAQLGRLWDYIKGERCPRCGVSDKD